MIFNYLYGGIKMVTVTINGAPGEEIILTPTKTILKEVKETLDSLGVITLTLPKDKYIITGSISKRALSSVTYDFIDGETYNLWGDYYPLYWYGRDCVAWSHYTVNAYAASYHKSEEVTNSIPNYYYAQIKAAGTQGSYSDCHLCFATANKVDMSNYDKIKFDVNITAITLSPAIKGIRLGHSSQKSFGSSSSIESGVTGYYSDTNLDGIYEVASPKDSEYVIATSYCDLSGVASNQNSIAKMYACWLE